MSSTTPLLTRRPPPTARRPPPPRAAACFALLTLSSVTMTVGNQWLMLSTDLAKSKHMLVAAQNSVAVGALLAAMAAGRASMAPVTRAQLLYFAWDAGVLVVQLWTSFEALERVSVSCVTVFRALQTPATALLERAALGEAQSARRHGCCWLIVLGAALFASEDWAANAAGYRWLLANLAACASNSIVDKAFFTASAQTASGCTLITQLISVPIALATGWALGARGLADAPATEAWHALARADAAALAVVAATGVVASLLGWCYTSCYKRASATAVTVASNCNKLLSIAASALLFGGALSPRQLAGGAVCVGAALAYSLEDASARDAKKAS